MLIRFSFDPMLRIEADMHTAAVRKLSTDAGNRFLVSVSDDKTVRIWGIAEKKLLRILRPPVGEGNEGKLFALSVTPDG